MSLVPSRFRADNSNFDTLYYWPVLGRLDDVYTLQYGWKGNTTTEVFEIEEGDEENDGIKPPAKSPALNVGNPVVPD